MHLRSLAYSLLIAGVVALPGLASATMECSIHPKKGATAAELKAQAKISLETAQATALASLKAGAAPQVAEAELEREHGCLVYSFDIRLPGVSGIEEVQVDAGNGKVLSHGHESAKAEAAEKAKEAAEKKPPVRRR